MNTEIYINYIKKYDFYNFIKKMESNGSWDDIEKINEEVRSMGFANIGECYDAMQHHVM